MDHFIMALKVDPAVERPSLLLSLYWVGHAADAEPGHVAYLWTSADGDQPAIEVALTDNPALFAALGPRLRPGQFSLSDPGRPAVAAAFRRSTAVDGTIAFAVDAQSVRVEARWGALGAAVYASGPTASGEARIASLLIESLEPSVVVNGRSQPGVPFPNPIWRPWFGEERGSCIIGLGETIYEPAAEVIS
jgi:hypothetical protein